MAPKGGHLRTTNKDNGQGRYLGLVESANLLMRAQLARPTQGLSSHMAALSIKLTTGPSIWAMVLLTLAGLRKQRRRSTHDWALC